ncbi:MAG: lysylphosphatidylglycerol synthase transmembrane domain-containing protein [Bdellovibrionota bacterium]
MLKTLITTFLKLAVAFALIYWLLKSGKLDLSLIAELGKNPMGVLISVLLAMTNIWIISVRWRGILEARNSVHIPLLGLVRANWIGQFFSSVLPGSVTGDLIKIIYIQEYDKNLSKKFVFATILIDRVMGLCGLILLVGMTSVLFQDHIIENAPATKPLLMFNYALSAAVLVGMAIFVFFDQFVHKIFALGEKILFPKIWQKFGDLWNDLVSIKKQMLKALCLSLVVQFTGVLIFWSLIYPFVVGKMDFVQALAFIPLGLMTLALPIAPSGLGVGHAIFQKLFEFSGINNGASLFNLFFFITLLVNIAGIIPYLLSRKNKPA